MYNLRIGGGARATGLILAFSLLLCAVCGMATAQDAIEQVETTQEAIEQSDIFVAAVEIDGETLFALRGTTALPAEERAEIVQDRIRALPKARTRPPLCRKSARAKRALRSMSTVALFRLPPPQMPSLNRSSLPHWPNSTPMRLPLPSPPIVPTGRPRRVSEAPSRPLDGPSGS